MAKKPSNKRWFVIMAGLAIAVLIGSQLIPNQNARHQQGQLAYDEHCASCHGSDLTGTRQGPPFLHVVYEPSHHGDEAFYRAIANGVQAHHWRFGDMPAVPKVSREQAKEIIAYIRQRQREVGIK
ncbi:c-type cytochrome [Oceanisphaera avium]|uniref:Cytochrome C n=1 Tax=Oceanisphaera avium TaxID=1903694 RepID=A0A1Y0CW83_9GAMM|nr:cytochrome c [Oceanisphaera avium]ART79176.1 cytochrome C [Oceanisphaera avium]